MAHAIYTKETKQKCPRCGAGDATVGIYHFGSTYMAECAECGYGKITGDSEEQALSRLNGRYYEYTTKEELLELEKGV